MIRSVLHEQSASDVQHCSYSSTCMHAWESLVSTTDPEGFLDSMDSRIPISSIGCGNSSENFESPVFCIFITWKLCVPSRAGQFHWTNIAFLQHYCISRWYLIHFAFLPSVSLVSIVGCSKLGQHDCRKRLTSLSDLRDSEQSVLERCAFSRDKAVASICQFTNTSANIELIYTFSNGEAAF